MYGWMDVNGRLDGAFEVMPTRQAAFNEQLLCAGHYVFTIHFLHSIFKF